MLKVTKQFVQPLSRSSWLVAARLMLVVLFILTFTIACWAKSKPDPWQEFKTKELARLEQYGEPDSFYAVYEGSFGPAKIRMATWFVGDDLFRVDSDMGIISVAMGSDGEHSWMQTKGAKPRMLSASEKEELFSSKYFDSVDYLKDDKLVFEYGDSQIWDKGKVAEVKLTSPDGYRRDLFIYEDTFELAGYRSYGTSTVLVKILDSEWYGAMNVPKKISMELVDLNLALEFSLVTAEIDVEVDPTLFIPPAGELKPLITKDDKPVSINFSTSASGLIFLDGSVGDNRGTFLFDTGASSSIIDKSILESLNVTERSGFAAVGVAGAEGAEVIRIVEQVSIGESKTVELPNEISYITMDLTPISKGVGKRILGIIGNDLPARTQVTIDFPNHKLTLNPYSKEKLGKGEENPLAALLGTAEKPELKANEFELEFVGDLIAVKGLVSDTYEANFILDTGFSGEIGLLPTAVEPLKLDLTSPKAFDIVHGVGGVTKLKGWIAKIKVKSIGVEREFLDVPVISGPIASVVGGSADGLIGSHFLKNMVIELDYNGGVLRVLDVG